MQYGSSYAKGMNDTGFSVQPLPTPKPSKLHWSTYIFGSGMTICALALLATIAGVPASMGYDSSKPGEITKPTSSDPLALTRSMEANMGWMEVQSNADKKHYVGLIKSINDHEIAIPEMAGGLASMSASVVTIDAKLKEVLFASRKMSSDMSAIVGASSASAETMASMGKDVNSLSSVMSNLSSSTSDLDKKMGKIQGMAKDIADKRTSAALQATKSMNETLPDSVPKPQEEGSVQR